MVDVVSTYPLPTSSDIAAAYDAASGTIYVHRTATGYYADTNEYDFAGSAVEIRSKLASLQATFAGWERTDR